MVMEKYEGNIPDTWEAFRKLPGVGDYIAGAVMSIAFGRCHPVGVVVKKDRVLITKRKNEGLLGGLWEFPGGKVKKGETAADACIREIGEEVNLKISVDRHLTRVNHAYTHFKIVMDVFICNYVSGRVNRKGPVAHKWIAIEKIHLYPFPKANHKFIPLLKQLPIAKDNTGRTIR